MLEGCHEHGAGLIYPSTVRAAVDRPPDPYALSKRLGEEACPLHPAAATVDRLTSIFGPGQVALGEGDGRDRDLRGARARGRADRDRRRSAADARLPLRRRPRAGARADRVEGRWNELLTLGSGVSTPLRRAAELVRDAAGSESAIQTPGGDLPAGENESYESRPFGPKARLRASAPSRSPFPSMSTGSVAIPLLKAAPEPEQIADRLEAVPGAGSSLASRRATWLTRPRSNGRSTRTARPMESGSRCTAEAPVSWPSGAFVSVDCLTTEARAGIERSAASQPRSDRQCSRSTCSPRWTPADFARRSHPRRRRGRAVPDASTRRPASSAASSR